MKTTGDEPENNEEDKELLYWLSKTPAERVAEVTRLIRLDLEPGQRMDKTHVVRTKLHPDK